MDAPLVEFFFALRQADPALRKVLRNCVEHGVNDAELALLNAVKGERGLRIAGLHKSLSVGVTTVNNAMKSLQEKGLIERRVKSHRNRVIVLSKKGRYVFGRTLDALQPALRYLWGDLPPEDIAAAGRVLKNLLERTL